MKKIEGVVVYYTDGSRERLSAQQIMERFFGGFVQEPSQNTSGVSQISEPRVVEPEKTIETTEKEVANVGLPSIPSVASEDSNQTGSDSLKKLNVRDVKPPADDKDYRAATCTRFPFGGDELRGKSILECIMWDRAFMEKVAKNTKGRNADLSHKINLVLSRNPPREDD